MSNEEKVQPKFNPFDGLDREDFIALRSGLVNFTKRLLTIVFYPFIYIFRNLGRLRGFLSNTAGRPLTRDEIRFITSWPLFLSIVGLMLGAIFGLFGFLVAQDAVLLQLEDLTNIVIYIGGLIVWIFNIIRDILGFIWDILVILKNIVTETISENFLISFSFVALVGFIGAIVVLLFIESRIIDILLEKLGKGFDFLFSLPRRSYDYLDGVVWNKLVEKLGKPVVGGSKIENYSNIYFKRLIISTFVFSLLFFIIALYALFFIQYTNLPDITDQSQLVGVLTVIIFVLILTGVFAGFPITYFYMWLLSTISGEKYSLKSIIETATDGKVQIESKVTTTSSKVSTTKTQAKETAGLSAKERAMARRKNRKK